MISSCLKVQVDNSPSFITSFTGEVSLLDGNGLSPAVYHADGDYIDFTADCAIQISNAVPVR